MADNARFQNALRILASLAQAPDNMRSSFELGEMLHLNPVVVRRLLSQLQVAELVYSQKGPGGGTMLAMPPDKITFEAVYEAVGGGLLPRLQVTANGSRAIEREVAHVLNKGESAMRGVLRSLPLTRVVVKK